MKILNFAICALLSISANETFAKGDTILHIPLFVEITGGPGKVSKVVSVREINKELVKKGQKKQIEFVNLVKGSKFSAFEAEVSLEAALAAAGLKNVIPSRESVPQNFGTKDDFTCYIGDSDRVIDDVIEIVSSQADNLYSDQFSPFAGRLGSKIILPGGEKMNKTTSDFLNKSSELWKNYDKESKNVLILSSIGDSGSDVNESLIPVCPKP